MVPEPHPPIFGLPRASGAAVDAFPRTHPIPGSEREAVNRPYAPRCVVVQFPLAYAEDSPVAAYPEVSEVVLQDIAHRIVKQSLIGRPGSNPSVADTVQSARHGAHPDRSLRVGVDGYHVIVHEAVPRRVGHGLSVP
jgi:hypothetical protein